MNMQYEELVLFKISPATIWHNGFGMAYVTIQLMLG
jgi:hypothetical protein